MIYVNGDSHSSGHGIDSHERYSYHLEKYFNHPCENQAHGGASNQYIIRTTKEYLHNYQPDLVIIGWTTWEREEWYHAENYHNVNSSGYDSLPMELQQQYKDWVASQNEITLKIKSDYWHTEIWKFHQELTAQRINHLFFNCMYNFFDVKIPNNWSNCFIGPYDNDSSYYWHLKSQGYTTDHLYHYGPDGQEYWAKFLINYIITHKLL